MCPRSLISVLVNINRLNAVRSVIDISNPYPTL